MSKFFRYEFDHKEMTEKATESCILLEDNSFGQMSVRNTQLQDGIHLNTYTGHFNRAVELWSDNTYENKLLNLFVNLAGTCECYIASINQTFVVPTKKIVVYYSAETAGYTRMLKTNMKGVSVSLPLTMFKDMINEDQNEAVIKRFSGVFKSDPEPFYLLVDATPAILESITLLDGLQDDTFCSRLKQRGLGWQLCGEIIHQIYLQNGQCNCHLSPIDVQKIHQARDILASNMENPPTLIELARQVGLNDFKLKQGFKAVFQQTAFGFLQQYRMEKARELLVNGEEKVINIANEVGYRNHGHFSAAFRKHYGQTPRQYLKNIKGIPLPIE